MAEEKKFHPADTNGDGKVSKEEEKMYLEFKRKELEDADAMRDAQRKGTGSHNATIILNNGSAPSTLDLTQSGSTSQSYSLEQTCYTLGGCSATVTQN